MVEQHNKKIPHTIQQMALLSSDSGASYKVDDEEGDIAESIASTEYSSSTERESVYLLDKTNNLQENYITNERHYS